MLERTLHTFLTAAHSKTCATMSSLCPLLLLNRVEAAMPSHPPLPRQTNPQNAEIQCYKLIQQVAQPLLLARSNRAADVRRAAVKGTHLCEVYWLSTSCFLGGSQDAGICELASSAFLPCWHDVCLLRSLVSTCWLQGQCPTPVLVKLLYHGLPYGVDHGIRTPNFLGKEACTWKGSTRSQIAECVCFCYAFSMHIEDA